MTKPTGLRDDAPATAPAPGRGSKRLRRLAWLLGIGLLCVALAVGYIHYYLYLPVGSGPAGPAVPLEPFNGVWSERRVLLVGLGDSVTAGLGSSRGRSYFERLVENPPDEFPDMQGRSLRNVLPQLETLNLAVSGSNSSQHLETIEQKLPQQASDVFGLVVMTSGGNDLIHWYGRTPPVENAMYGATLTQAQPWIANYEQRLDDMLTAIKSRFPGGCLILLADIYDPSDGRGDPESVRLPRWRECVAVHAAYNQALQRAADRHAEVHVVPAHAEFLGHGIHCRKFWLPTYRSEDPHYWYAPNIEDPNDRGYDALRRLYLLKLIELREAFGDR
jgi:lysophospholipase L1-like esterase